MNLSTPLHGRVISEARVNDYRATARARKQQRRAELEQRLADALRLAQSAADLLRNDFAAQRVALFGSIARRELFHLRSDIDLAVWGLSDASYYRALARLLDLCRPFDVDLVQMEHAPPSLCERVRREGATL